MATTDETKVDPGDSPPEREESSGLRALKRYGPIAAVLILIAGAVVLFGGGGGDDEEDAAPETDLSTTEQELILSGPMTPQRAELEGVDVDFGPNCDLETGRIMLISVYAPPCVEPFEGDNGGATSPGVTADEVLIVDYDADPALDPLLSATIEDAGADVDPETANQVTDDFVDLYNELFETYGRTVRIESFTGTGAGTDTAAAQADAIAISEMEPFAVVGGPAQALGVFSSTLAENGIICGPGCADTLPQDIVEEYDPYLWPTGPTPNQAVQLAAEMVGNLAGPGPAELAGTPEMQSQDRVYGLLHYDNADGDHVPVMEEFRAALTDNGIEIGADVEFTLDLARAQENARTNIGRLMEAGVTTIIYYGDPLTPASLTREATAQGYYPEWILGPNVLMDTTIFARQVDTSQWKNGFGMALIGARGERSTNGAWQIYEWAFGREPQNNTINAFEPPVRAMFAGIHLAGPNLTPETFRDSLLRYPVSGGGPTEVQVSRGNHGIWPEFDWGGSDDMTLIWFDPEATGEDETGAEGVGMYRYANMGERYTIGNLPASLEESGIGDVENSVTVYDEVPEEDTTPRYEPPEIG
jgi:hypothetical protein